MVVNEPTEAFQPDFTADHDFTVDQLADTGGAPRISLRTLCVTSAAFWVYVTATDILYTHISQIIHRTPGFAPWSIRAIQHLLLFFPLVACYWISLGVGWMSVVRICAQVAFAAVFASLGYYSMWLAEAVYFYLSLPPAAATAALAGGPPAQAALWVANFVGFLLPYWLGLTIVTALAWYKRFQESQLDVAKLRAEWSNARLSALRLQLSPHTLFNLLHTIHGRVRSDPDHAQEMIVRLAGLLRRLLRAGQREFCLLGEELHFVSSYLELQQQRFSDRLSVEVPQPERQPAIWVPTLILQPLVENAVVHGLAGHEGPVDIHVDILLSAESLILRVTNTTAPGVTRRATGVGLNNVRERLRVHFGNEATLSMEAADATTWVAQIAMPRLSQMTASRAGG